MSKVLKLIPLLKPFLTHVEMDSEEGVIRLAGKRIFITEEENMKGIIEEVGDIIGEKGIGIFLLRFGRHAGKSAAQCIKKLVQVSDPWREVGKIL